MLLYIFPALFASLDRTHSPASHIITPIINLIYLLSWKDAPVSHVQKAVNTIQGKYIPSRFCGCHLFFIRILSVSVIFQHLHKQIGIKEFFRHRRCKHRSHTIIIFFLFQPNPNRDRKTKFLFLCRLVSDTAFRRCPESNFVRGACTYIEEEGFPQVPEHSGQETAL
mgnify:CR=1 FL=1